MRSRLSRAAKCMSGIFLGLSLLASGAQAGNWLEYFGSPYEWRLWGTEESMGAVSPDSNCRGVAAFAENLRKALSDYRFAAMESESRFTSQVQEWVVSTLRNVEARDPGCFNAYAGVYLMASLEIGHFQAAPTPQARYTIEDRASFIAAYLLRHGKVRFLTPGVRDELGGLWVKSGRAHRFKVMGAYRCKDGQIMVDPYLAPFNLAAAWIHELDHLLRDRLRVGPDGPEASRPFSSLGLNARRFLLLDESLALTVTGLRQRLSQWGGSSPSRSAWKIRNDSDLFGRKGPLERLWQASKIEPSSRFWFFDFDLETFLQRTFLSGRRPEALAPLRELYEIVNKNYFTSKLSLADEAGLLGLATTELSPIAALSKPETSGALEDARMSSWLGQLEESLKGTSASCAAIEAEGDKEYLGSKLGAKDKSSHRPGANGDAGVRPGANGDAGVRPGANGDAGVRPGANGDAGVRPCLFPE